MTYIMRMRRSRRQVPPVAPGESLARKLALVPRKPGVYLMQGAGGEILYVGKAKDLRSRVRSYFSAGRTPHPRTDALVGHIAEVEYFVTDSEVEALLLESNLIKEHSPRFNIELRDDKSYPYIKVTLNEPYPRVLITRRLRDDGGRYFGPYTQVGAMRRNLALIKDLFPVRSCRYELPAERPSRPCLDWFIKKCDAPCVGYVDRDAYRRMIDEVVAFLAGDVQLVATRIRERMGAAAERLDFEGAALLKKQLDALLAVEEGQRMRFIEGEDRDVIALARMGDMACGLILKVRRGGVTGKEHRLLRNLTAAESDPSDALGLFVTRHYLRATEFPPEILLPFEFPDLPLVEAWLRANAPHAPRLHVPRRGEKRKLLLLAQKNASLILEEESLRGESGGRRAADVVRALQAELGLPRLPRRIACFDVSTIQGADPVGAGVVFDDGQPRKAEYRRFRIKYVEGQDDFAMMAEIVGRYLRGRLEGGEDLPDLLVVDGGKGQLGSALAVLRELGVDDVPVIALAKQDEEVFLAGRGESVTLPRRSEALRLLQRIRNEAHRFAVTYHRRRRSARTLVTAAEGLPGVGPRRGQALLSRFGSIERLRAATPEQIATLPGFSLRTAQRVLDHLRGGAGDAAPEAGAAGAGGSEREASPSELASLSELPALPDGELEEPVFDGMGRSL
ncbi:MAG: excinuclease ABC subunit UvrC [Gemmatimonadetes bacterium]|nr:excinuclease ABC subunit UvrC [Gemmatimonadota bacterium]